AGRSRGGRRPAPVRGAGSRGAPERMGRERERAVGATSDGCGAREGRGRVLGSDRDTGRGAAGRRERELPGRSGGPVTLEPVPGRGNPPLCRVAPKPARCSTRYASSDDAKGND